MRLQILSPGDVLRSQGRCLPRPGYAACVARGTFRFLAARAELSARIYIFLRREGRQTPSLASLSLLQAAATSVTVGYKKGVNRGTQMPVARRSVGGVWWWWWIRGGARRMPSKHGADHRSNETTTAQISVMGRNIVRVPALGRTRARCTHAHNPSDTQTPCHRRRELPRTRARARRPASRRSRATRTWLTTVRLMHVFKLCRAQQPSRIG